MPRNRVAVFLLPVALVLLHSVTVRSESGGQIEPAAGIEWNDRVFDVQRKLAAIPEVRRIDVSLLFNDTVTTERFGPRAAAPGSESELLGAVSALAGDYLAGVDADRKTGSGRLAKAFDLHCAGILADKAGVRKDYLDAVLRISAGPVGLHGVPFELTAEFRAHPGAGLTGRNSLPVRGTKYILPVVLTKVTLVPTSPSAGRRFREAAEALKKSFARYRRRAVGAPEGWCDDRQVTVSFAADAPAIRYDAETYWLRGLDAMYKDHVNTLNGGKACRCHATRAREFLF